MLHSEGLENRQGHRDLAVFWHFPSFARGQYQRTAPTRKIRNLSHFLKVLQRVEICNWTFSTRYEATNGRPYGVSVIYF